MSKNLSECVIVAGQTGNENVLAKTRDRNYVPEVKLVRDIFDNGIETVYMVDLKTGFLEGMNSNGLGIVNSTLMVYEDENPLDHGTQKQYGNIIKTALSKSSITDAIKCLVELDGGVEGHTFVGDQEELYSIERTKHHPSKIKKLNPKTGFDIHTNHGDIHSTAGYQPDTKPDDYLSSIIRKATAKVNLADSNDYTKIAKNLLAQDFDPESNYNLKRRTSNLRTKSQMVMNLPKKEMLFYVFPDECNFHGLEDNCPKDHDSRINVRLFNWKD
jgi:hypothetical protein